MGIYNYKTNDLFRFDEPVHLNACVGKNGGPYNFEDYSLGYFDAAGVLVKAAIDGQLDIDTAIYPITYNYRHGIELGLKHLYTFLPSIWNEAAPQIRATHKLIDVWDQTKPYLLRDNEFDKHGRTVSIVSKVLHDIVQFDPDAEVFRFPTERSGAFYLQDSAHINVLVLAESLEEVRSIFETWFRVATALKYGE